MPHAPALSPEQIELLATWYPVVVERCRVNIRHEADAYDVAHNVMERLLAELRRGKTYAVPYPVVVHNVIRWKIKEHFTGRPLEAELDEALAAPDAFERFEADHDFLLLLEGLPPREYEVLDLLLRERLDIDRIAARLGIERNAVDQALFRARKKLRKRLRG